MSEPAYEYLIIGGGLAAATAIKELVRIKPASRIGVLASETEPPYRRPPLSKEYLLDRVERQSLFLLPSELLADFEVDLRLGVSAQGVDAERHLVSTAAGDVGYEKLLIASGCSLRRLHLPGSDLPGVCYLRTLDESEAIKAAADSGKQAVVIGGGFIGLELAATLSQLDVSTTIVHRSDRLFEKFAQEQICTFFERLFQEHGVHVVYQDEAAAFEGSGRVENIATKGGRILPCDFACIGIGVLPDTDYLEGSGLKLGNGVLVDQQLKASQPDIYAAGDVANFYDPVFQRQRRVEHWDNAIRQAKIAARNMAGGQESYRHVSYFYSSVFGLTYEFFGDMSCYDQTMTRGSFEQRSAAVFYLREGVLQAAFLMNRSAKERNVVGRLIEEQQQLGPVQNRLSDESFELSRAIAA